MALINRRKPHRVPSYVPQKRQRVLEEIMGEYERSLIDLILIVDCYNLRRDILHRNSTTEYMKQMSQNFRNIGESKQHDLKYEY